MAGLSGMGAKLVPVSPSLMCPEDGIMQQADYCSDPNGHDKVPEEYLGLVEKSPRYKA